LRIYNNEIMRYQTFDLSISATGTPHEYLLAAQSTQGEPNARTKIEFDAAPLNAWLQQLAEHTLAPKDLPALGVALYECLFVGEINLVFQRALGETLGCDDLGLRLRLRLNPPELTALPWEYLYSPERRLFLAASVETPVSRYLNLPEPIRQLACPAQINLLAVVTKNSGLDTSDEQLALKEVATKLGGKINLTFLEGEATSMAIRAALRKKAYHIFHYAGHGSFESNAAFIHLDHAENLTAPMSAGHFAQFFVDYPSLRFVFLNACQGAARSAREALVGVAPQLVLRGVPAVVAMQDRIANDDAILFATEFYEELCNSHDSGQVEAAISRARKALLQERPTSAVFGNPVLYLRADDGRLWEAKKTGLFQPPPGDGKKPLLERWQTWVTLIGGILAILVGVLQLPSMIDTLLHPQKDEPPKIETATSYLRVFVIDSTSRAPLADVKLTVTELLVDTVFTATTTSDGGFHFKEIPAPVNSRARVYAEKEGYRGKNEYTALPGPLKFELEKIK